MILLDTIKEYQMNRSHIFHWFILKEFLPQVIGIHYPKEIIMLIIMNNYKPIKISCGAVHTILIKDDVDGVDVYVWGGNSSGQLGLGDHQSRCSPQKLDSFKTESGFRHVSSGYAAGHIILLTNENNYYAWGHNAYSQLGLGYVSACWNGNVNLPTYSRILCGDKIDIISISCNWVHTLAITKSNECYSYGLDHTGYHGLNKINLSNVILTSCGENHMVVLTQTDIENKIYVYGRNNHGQLGLGDTIDRLSFQKLNLSNIMSVNCGKYFTMALTICGKLYGWGSNAFRQLGLGNVGDQYLPQQLSLQESITSITSIISVNCGAQHTFILTKNGKLYGWGCNDLGQLGLGNNFNTNIPTEIVFCEFVKSVYCGGYHTIVVTDRDKIYVWGDNGNGQLGLGDINIRISPQELKCWF